MSEVVEGMAQQQETSQTAGGLRSSVMKYNQCLRLPRKSMSRRSTKRKAKDLATLQVLTAKAALVLQNERDLHGRRESPRDAKHEKSGIIKCLSTKFRHEEGGTLVV